MPTYAYACTECDHRFEVVQSFSDDTLTLCPECRGRLRKLFNAVGIVFKGGGFYRTDSRSGSSVPGGSSNGASEGGSTEAGSSSGSPSSDSSSSNGSTGSNGSNGSKGSNGSSGSGSSSTGPAPAKAPSTTSS